jgi:hypothetical protein
VETVDAGWNTLADLDVETVRRALEQEPVGERPDLSNAGRAGLCVREAITQSLTSIVAVA